jgi:S-adenosylmethionine:tRNA ribosyltransferase-isomerase
LGSIAAPTAGLHFSQELIDQLIRKNIRFIPITLHVGLGTFQSLREDHLQENQLHPERYEISDKSAQEINQSIQNGNRLIVVGTTTARALESAAMLDGFVKAGQGMTTLFIHPPYSFKIVKNLLTNFHLPRSSLLMLVAALIGREILFPIYDEAIHQKYRFYSYGDAMLVLSEE